ncbi:lipoprotein [Bordetella pertussis]|uniref:Exported protein n=1 Tax=Bordetella pertussis (strain ATCC 9797 / DSM 5571 / CCUG 30873 / LMG 14455 / NCTC 10739 / 18323) TaxID=568706 RepID=A0A0T7CR51_BORP1|nr:tripartite tricarboxylate transporter substrate binding protein [Bordetella pertussis]AZR86341.1 ABC transporter substrate-binding protein [Bordetella pertussis]PNO99111.1 tripartite tricarboxylate transporter substrate binding protein [Bordetella pertussis 18323]UEB57255.1 tripartite tricarboxylate transporter substrate binding protein [Bordetella pertussis]CCJ64858.1 putative exported protein [Bordetella pertussis 18323]CFP45560.1 lipoprotein [Bordetella pertussis]
MHSRTLALALLFVAALAQGGSARAASDYPAHPVKIIVSLPPGSGADTTARFLSKHLAERFKQPFVVENRPGGNSFIAAQAVATAPPDGYTLFVASNSPMTTNAAVFKNLPYDAVKDFAPVAPIARFPMALVVPANSPYRSVADLVAAARAAPGQLNFASGTATYQVVLELFHEQNGIKATHVPYKGTSAALADVAGGVVQYSVADVSAALPLIRGGKLRPLAVTSTRRIKDLPDVPTMQESGNKGFEAYAWTAAFFPAKVDPAIVARVSDAVQALVRSQEGKAFMEQLGGEPFVGGPDTLAAFQRDELASMRRIAKLANIQQE